MFKDFYKGIGAYSKAYDFIREKKLKSFWFITGIFCFLIYIGLAVGLWFFADQISSELWSKLPYSKDLEDFSPFIQTLFRGLINSLFIILYFKIFRYVILFIYMPILALSAEYFHRWLPVNYQQTSAIKEILRGMIMSVRNVMKELLITLPLLFLSFLIPFSFPFFFIAIFLIESYYFGFSMLEYSKVLSSQSVKDSLVFIRKRKGLALGIGLIFNVGLLVPIVGALFMPLLALIAGLLSLQEENLPQSHFS